MIGESDLSPKQREVVEAQERVLLVLGGAGSGKTTTALWAARAELLSSDVPSRRVAFLTFSRTAVDQISSRSASALVDMGTRVEISTFHAMAYRLVRAFGRYAGIGIEIPDLQSPAQIKLQGPSDNLLSYDDLMPMALRVLESKRVRNLLGRRWPLVICDEFQDTSDEQWELLKLLNINSRLILLADPNQMIYTFVRGVSVERLREASDLADRIVELEEVSHRDPSGAIPALALAVMRRQFESGPVLDAVAAGRLRVRTEVDDADLIEVIREELADSYRNGARDFGIFGHSNAGVASLGHRLAAEGIEHVLIGLPEAQGEGVAVMDVMCQFAMGAATREDLRSALATYLTACSRGAQAPALALALARGGSLPSQLEDRLISLENALRAAAPDPVALSQVIARAWPSLGILAGSRPWDRALPAFGPVLRHASRGRELDDVALSVIARQVREMRSAALLESNRMRLPPTKLMNFHQTKGREADAVILVYRDGDVLSGWNDSEPYEESSRVLYVSLTRARQRLSVVLPTNPHPLVAPFVELAP